MKGPPQLRDCAYQHIVAYKGIGPNRLTDHLTGNNVTRMLSQEQQNLHHFWLYMERLIMIFNRIEPNTNKTLADPEISQHTNLSNMHSLNTISFIYTLPKPNHALPRARCLTKVHTSFSHPAKYAQTGAI